MKQYLLIVTLLLNSIGALATKHSVLMSNFTFTPSNLQVNVGDTVSWTLSNGVHTTTSTSVPVGALSWNSGTMSTQGQTFEYIITTAGTYTYQCNIHGGSMSGTIIASGATGINAIPHSLVVAYPNPFLNKVSFNLPKADYIKICTLEGRSVFSSEISSGTQSLEIDLTHLSSGCYLYSLYKQGEVIETKKILKK